MQQLNSSRLWSMFMVTLTLVVICACGQATPASETSNIFGPDNRVTPDDSGPYKAIGRLDSGCTGTLVGKNLVLTAAHCVLDSATGTIKPSVKFFRPDLRNGTSAHPAWVNFLWIGGSKPEDDRRTDWAFLRLDDDVGNTYGTLPIQTVDMASQLPYTVSLVGYSADRSSGNLPSLHAGCYVHKIEDGKIYHDCDATSGVSGGPLLSAINGNTYVVGITVSEFRQGAADSVTRNQYTFDYSNVGIPATGFMAVATSLIGTLDGGSSLPHFDGLTELVNPNARDSTEPSNPENPGNPGGDQLSTANIASQDVLVQRANQIKTGVLNLDGAIRHLRDLAYRTSLTQILRDAPRILGELNSFDSAMADAVNSRTTGGTYAEPLVSTFKTFTSDLASFQRFDSTQVPGPFVGEFEQTQRDIADLLTRLGTLIVR